MEATLRLSFGKIIAAGIVLAVIVSLLTLLAYVLGQRNGMELAADLVQTALNAQEKNSDSQSPEVIPVLPKAMTATPMHKPLEQWSINNEQATRLAQEQTEASTSGVPLLVNQIEFTESEMRITGEINYAGYMGDLEIVGYPVIEANQLNFHVMRSFLNGQVLPQIISPTVESQINGFFSQLFAGYDVIQVEMGDGVLLADLLPW